MKLVSLHGFIGVVLGAPDDGSDVTEFLNGLIQASSGDVYTAGTGLIVRAPDFISGGDGKVVPGSFWHNDIAAPSQFYPTQGNPWFPNDGTDGYGDISFQTTDLVDQWGNKIGPWTYASVGAVVGGAMKDLYPIDFDNIQDYDWGWGVFYAKDSNSVDQRCEWLDSQNGWDCNKGFIPLSGGWQPDSNRKGAGAYEPGNPVAGGGGGGAGCHFGGSSDLDQPDSNDPSGNLVSNYHCECNYDLKGNEWGDWFWSMVEHVQQKPNYQSSRSWLGGGGGLAPSWAMDATICWVSNPRDLIKMQNQFHWNIYDWNNQKTPATDFSTGSVEELRKYWGWNEIPVDRFIVEEPGNWDAIMIKLPAALCGDWDPSGQSVGGQDSVNCLGNKEKQALEGDLDSFVNAGKLLTGGGNVGNRPGSYIVIAREWGQTYGSTHELGSGWTGMNWQRWFFCEDVTIGKYQIVHQKPSSDPAGRGACYLDYAGIGPSPSPAVSWGAIIHSGSGKCVGSQYSDTSQGQAIVAVDCDGSGAQAWKFEDNNLKLLWEDTKCVDAGDLSEGNALFLWECNGSDQQKFGYDDFMGTIYASASSDATLCVDVQNGGTYSENVAWLWGCNSMPNQVFEWHKVGQSDIVT